MGQRSGGTRLSTGHAGGVDGTATSARPAAWCPTPNATGAKAGPDLFRGRRPPLSADRRRKRLPARKRTPIEIRGRNPERQVTQTCRGTPKRADPRRRNPSRGPQEGRLSRSNSLGPTPITGRSVRRAPRARAYTAESRGGEATRERGSTARPQRSACNATMRSNQAGLSQTDEGRESRTRTPEHHHRGRQAFRGAHMGAQLHLSS